MKPRTVVIGTFLLFLLAVITVLVIDRNRTREALTLKDEAIGNLEKKVRSLEEDLDLTNVRLEALENSLHQVQTDLSTLLFPESVTDTAGHTPDFVVRRYLAAEQQEDWKTTYDCLMGVPFSLEEYIADVKLSGEKIVAYRISGYRLLDRENAHVFVSLIVRYEGSDEDTRIETEPWAVIKDRGEWKVRWLARQ